MYNAEAVDILSRSLYLKIASRYETAILSSILINRTNFASDILARLKVKPSRILAYTQGLVTEDGVWTSEEQHAIERSLGCEEDALRREAASQALILNNDYIGSEHLLLAAVSCSSYLAEVLMSLYDIDRDKLRAKIIEKQSEPRTVTVEKLDVLRLLFRTIDLADDVKELDYISKALEASVNSWEGEKHDIAEKLWQWHEVRKKNLDKGDELRTALADEFPWIKY